MNLRIVVCQVLVLNLYNLSKVSSSRGNFKDVCVLPPPDLFVNFWADFTFSAV